MKLLTYGSFLGTCSVPESSKPFSLEIKMEQKRMCLFACVYMCACVLLCLCVRTVYLMMR